MSVSCNDLLKLGCFKRIKLLAGEKGLGRSLSWPYVGQTSSVSQWVHGGELLFITGIGRDNSVTALEMLVEECTRKGLCGLVLLVGSEFIREIPSSVICLAEENNLPLFEMPWDLKLIDVTSEIVHLLMEDQSQKRKSDSFLSRLLFPETGDHATMQELAETYGFGMHAFCFIAVFYYDIKSVGKDNRDINSLEVEIQQAIDNLCRQHRCSLISMPSGNRFICLASERDESSAKRVEEHLKAVCNRIRKVYPEEEIRLSFGRTYQDGKSVPASYREACKALEVSKKVGEQRAIISYNELGIYRLLLKVEDVEEVRQYYRYRLEPLLRYDAQNQSELVTTLYCYLKCDCNLIKTSRMLYVHRNTLVYRLGKIKELLGHNLEDAREKLELFNSLLAREFLGD